MIPMFAVSFFRLLDVECMMNLLHGTVFEFHQDGRIVHVVVLFEAHIGINPADTIDSFSFRSGELPGGVVIMGHHIGDESAAGGTELNDELLYPCLVPGLDT